MRYEAFSYLWPPRPEVATYQRLLPSFENLGWVAQIKKKNGTCSVIFVSPDKTVTAMSRHKEDHKAWQPTEEVMERFEALPGNGWYVFVAELLHSKVPGLRDINYLHDILVRDGEYLVGFSQSDRQDILFDLFIQGGEQETHSHYVINPNLWLVIEYEADFSRLFDNLTLAEDEGLVLKKPDSVLTFCSRQSANSSGQVKVRKAHNNFNF